MFAHSLQIFRRIVTERLVLGFDDTNRIPVLERAQLFARIAELAPLALQLKERDLRIKNFQGELDALAQAKDADLAKLQADLAAAIEANDADAQAHATETAQLNARLGMLESARRELEEIGRAHV